MALVFLPQVPFTYIEYESNAKLSPSIHQLFSTVDRYQLANSYGLFRRMTGVGGRPEVVVEGSYDKETWMVLCLSREGCMVSSHGEGYGWMGDGGVSASLAIANLIGALTPIYG